MDINDLNPEDLQIERLDHLGLVAGMCDELGLCDYFDHHLSHNSPDKRLSYGELIKGMILNGLGYVSQPLHMYPEFFRDKPLERLIGPHADPDAFNQHALGRTLDRLYEAGVSELFQGFAEQALDRLGLSVHGLHLDATSFHVDGTTYAAADEHQPQRIELKQGYSRDHRPDLNQVILNLIVEHQSGMPVFLQANSGHTNDKANFSALVNHHTSSLKQALESRYVVGDSALYTPASLQALAERQSYFVSRVPSTIKQAKQWLAHAPQATLKPLGSGYWAQEQSVTYAAIPQRWVLIWSEQAANRQAKHVKSQVRKQIDQEMKQARKLMRQSFACEADANQALAQTTQKWRYLTLQEVHTVAHPHYHKPGKPPQNAEPDYYSYTIQAQCASSLAAYQQAYHQKGYFILATNDWDNEFDASAILTTYKAQQKVERGFRFLKNPEFLTSAFYLKKPERIEALLMIMTLCLLIYCALEYRIRQALAQHQADFPDQKNQKNQKPTARWVFFCFQGISILKMGHRATLVTNLIPRHHIIVNVLGPPYQNIYSNSRGDE
jgi:transposase